MDRSAKWNSLIRLAAAVTAIAVWAVSIMFSVDGFAFQLPKYIWAGYVLGISVTIIELVFNEEGLQHNLTLIALSLSAYAYDVGTNVIGIWVAQGKPDLTGNIIGLIFPLIVGLFLALLPEPLFAWALIGTGYKDLLTHLFGEDMGQNKQSHSKHDSGDDDLEREKERLRQGWDKLNKARREQGKGKED